VIAWNHRMACNRIHCCTDQIRLSSSWKCCRSAVKLRDKHISVLHSMSCNISILVCTLLLGHYWRSVTNTDKQMERGCKTCVRACVIMLVYHAIWLLSVCVMYTHSRDLFNSICFHSLWWFIHFYCSVLHFYVWFQFTFYEHEFCSYVCLLYVVK